MIMIRGSCGCSGCWLDMRPTLDEHAQQVACPCPPETTADLLRVRLTGRMSHLTRVRALAGTVVLIAGLGTAAGCGDDGTTGVTKDGDKVSVTDEDEVTVDTDDGSVTAGQGLPDGFPSDDVPLLDEKVANGARGEADRKS